MTMWQLMKPSWCPHPNAGLMWDMMADVTLNLDNDGSLHDLAQITQRLALKIVRQDGRPTTESSEGNYSGDWMKEGTCLTFCCAMEGNVCGTGNCLNTLSEQHCQLAELYGRLRMSGKSELELILECHGVLEVNLITVSGFSSITGSIESLERLEGAPGLVTSLSVEVFLKHYRRSRRLEVGDSLWRMR